MKKQQSGFTLIELVMVIVILGILAAVALPKFADLKTDAQAAALAGLKGAIESASVINYAAVLAKQSTTNVSGSVSNVTITGLTCAVAVPLIMTTMPTGYTVSDTATGSSSTTGPGTAVLVSGTNSVCTLAPTSNLTNVVSLTLLGN